MKNFLLALILLSQFYFSQKKDSLATIENPKFELKKTYIPATLMIGGLLTDIGGNKSVENKIKEERNEYLVDFRNHIDDYMQFSPFVAIYGFEWLGLKPRTDWKNRTAILIKGQILNLGLVYILKKSINETRPDGAPYSFPSGHTANVFAGATMLSMEYGNDNKWVPYVAYGVASSVGIMRIANNRHYISDVLFGAGLGVLSMKFAYWTHCYQWNKKSEKDNLTILYRKHLLK